MNTVRTKAAKNIKPGDIVILPKSMGSYHLEVSDVTEGMGMDGPYIALEWVDYPEGVNDWFVPATAMLTYR